MAVTHVFPDGESIAHRFVEHLGELLAPRLTGARPLKVALSGGSTPKRAYELMANADLDTSKLELYMVDERYVPISDERSNERMIREAIGENISRFQFFPMYREGGVVSAAGEYNELLRRQVDKFDLILLGMGEDGHTASIFPGMWPEADPHAFCVSSEAPVVCPERITLTMRAICWARETVFMVTGAKKAERVREVQKDKPKLGDLSAQFNRLPAQYVHHHAINCQWWLDEAAATLIQRT
jgi:6-phosphogluconolactonase